MKNRILLALVSVLVLLGLFSACNTDDPTDPPPPRITISFELDDGNIGFFYSGDAIPPDSVTINKNASLGEKLPDLSEQDPNFLYWVTEEREPVTAGTVFIKTTTLYAVWTNSPNNIRISINWNYTGAPAERPEDFYIMYGEPLGEKLTAITLPDRSPDYSFTGWARTASVQPGEVFVTGDTFFDDDSSPAVPTNRRITLYARWQDDRPDITISYDTHKTERPNPGDYTMKAGDAIGGSNLPTLERIGEDFIFQGWFMEEKTDDPDAEYEAVAASTVFMEDTTIHAHWTGMAKQVWTDFTADDLITWTGGLAAAQSVTVNTEKQIVATYSLAATDGSQTIAIKIPEELREGLAGLPVGWPINVSIEAESSPADATYRFFIGTTSTTSSWNGTTDTGNITVDAMKDVDVAIHPNITAGPGRTDHFIIQARGGQVPVVLTITSIGIYWNPETPPPPPDLSDPDAVYVAIDNPTLLSTGLGSADGLEPGQIHVVNNTYIGYKLDEQENWADYKYVRFTITVVSVNHEHETPDYRRAWLGIKNANLSYTPDILENPNNEFIPPRNTPLPAPVTVELERKTDNFTSGYVTFQGYNTDFVMTFDKIEFYSENTRPVTPSLGTVAASKDTGDNGGLKLAADFTPDAGNPTVTYRWARSATEAGNLTNINSATEETYQPTQTGWYVVTVSSGGYLSAVSERVEITEADFPSLGTVTVEGENDPAKVNEELTATYTPATGITAVVTYTWEVGSNWDVIEDEEDDIFTPDEAGTYRVTVKTAEGGFLPAGISSDPIEVEE